MKTDYSDLVGKTVKVKDEESFSEFEVVGADYHVGLTLIHKDTKNHVVCYNGPESPVTKNFYKKHKIKNWRSRWRKAFFAWIKIIQKGETTVNEVENIFKFFDRRECGGYPDKNRCAFSQ